MTEAWLGMTALVLGLAAGLLGCSPASANEASVAMQGAQRYEPAVLEVAVGGTVSWRNDGQQAHTVTSVDQDGDPSGAFDSGEVIGTGSFSHTFEEAGEYAYFCRFHGDREMVGVVVVTP